ncbi:hypothetical protein GQ54DRAFT_294847 [Martensiomyces pterosporus]|nr:hypothetical protein GQ54DRAFT_294847 [Martensiomyces pterosporus]
MPIYVCTRKAKVREKSLAELTQHPVPLQIAIPCNLPQPKTEPRALPARPQEEHVSCRSVCPGINPGFLSPRTSYRVASDARMDSTKLQTLVKPLLRRVLLKVHPDFFASDPAAKRVNQASVQRLQDLLSPVLKPQTSAESRSVPNKSSGDASETPLEFICRNGDSLETISFAFKDGRARGSMRLGAQRTRDFLGLCSKLKVDAPPSTVSEIEAIVGQMEAESNGKHLGRTANAMSAAAVEQLRAARAREARQNYTRGQAAADPYAVFTEKLRQSNWGPGARNAKRAEMKLDRSKVFFASSVDPQEYPKVVGFIESQLHSLNYSHWCNLPLMVVSDWNDAFRRSRPLYPGFVVVPCRFTVPGKLQVRVSSVPTVAHQCK